GNLKGSCRSDGTLSLVDLFGAAGDFFEQFGGHAHSGGFTVSHERVHTMQEVLAAAAALCAAAPSKEALQHDASLPLASISHELLTDISRLSPFGMGNPKPIFLVPEARIGAVKRFGKEKNHVEVLLECERTERTIRAFEFFKGPEHFSQPPEVGASASILATLERDTYRGPRALALRIVDVLPAC
ncbi:MAG TPA: hypothetical protein VN495_00405, partial [Candidatus Paceibacterota bacterium]|nr:hypothetical protein [Candidatus Paceibacterota bacterium]